MSAREPKRRSLHDRALGLLAVRARSRRELERRLIRAGFEADAVSDELDRLESVGLVDDGSFADQVVEHETRSRLSGARAVRSSLAAKGVPTATIEAAVSGIRGDEEARASELASSRAGRLRALDPATAFRRLSSLLVRRGYTPEVARTAARRALELGGEPEP